jgi:hypothetical protein
VSSSLMTSVLPVNSQDRIRVGITNIIRALRFQSFAHVSFMMFQETSKQTRSILYIEIGDLKLPGSWTICKAGTVFTLKIRCQPILGHDLHETYCAAARNYCRITPTFMPDQSRHKVLGQFSFPGVSDDRPAPAQDLLREPRAKSAVLQKESLAFGKRREEQHYCEKPKNQQERRINSVQAAISAGGASF